MSGKITKLHKKYLRQVVSNGTTVKQANAARATRSHRQRGEATAIMRRAVRRDEVAP